MKQMIIGSVGLLLIVYAVYINMNFAEAAARETEVAMAVSHGISQTLEAHRSENFKSENEMEQYFCDVLKSQIISEGILEIHIITADCQYGMLDVEVIQHFQTSDQKGREVTVRKCGIIDEQPDG